MQAPPNPVRHPPQFPWAPLHLIPSHAHGSRKPQSCHNKNAFWNFTVHRITQYIDFCVWLHSLSIMFLRFICSGGCLYFIPFWLSSFPPYGFITLCSIQHIHLVTRWWILGLFTIWVDKNKAAVNIHVASLYVNVCFSWVNT